MKTTSLIVPLLTAAFVSAHGFLSHITINDKPYYGSSPKVQDPPPSIIRQIASVDPIKGANNDAITCGLNAKPAANVANANPGDRITINWQDIDSPWIHDTGPLMTYMADCGDVTPDQFDTSGAKWFKIDQRGRMDDATAIRNGLDVGSFEQAVLMRGRPTNITLPSNLRSGNYILRHDIIALHTGDHIGGAEFYAGCAQIKVGGSQNGGPRKDELVSLPGAYNDNDPGINDPSVYDKKVPYVFPGPAVASFVGASSSDTTPSGTTPTDTTGTTPIPTTPTNTTPTDATPTDATPTDATPTLTNTPSPSPSSVKPTPGKTCKAKRASRKRHHDISRITQRQSLHPSNSTNSSSRK